MEGDLSVDGRATDGRKRAAEGVSSPNFQFAPYFHPTSARSIWESAPLSRNIGRPFSLARE